MVDAGWRRLVESAARRYGVVTVQDARAVGVDPKRLMAAAGRGEVERVGVGVYRFPIVPPSDRQAARIATAAAGGALTGESALALWGCDGCRLVPITVAVPHRRSPKVPNVRISRSRSWNPAEVVERHRLPLLRPLRALVDAASDLTPDTLEVLVVTMRRRGLATFEEVQRYVGDVDGRGRAGVGTLRRLVNQAATVGLRESPLEILLDDLVRNRGLPAPLRQHPVPTAGGEFRPDFLWLPERLIVECDGAGAHAGALELRRDLRRQNHLVMEGFTVLRYTWWDVRDEPGRVVAEVLAALRRAA